MSWVKLKMQELGVLDNPNYNVVALMDSAAMISVETHKYGILQCKPLGVIWANFGGRWSNKNTIMFDDLRRNFVMNPQSGLKVRPYKNAFFNYDRDRELRRLTRYLEHIATFPDFSVLEHREWERYARKRPRVMGMATHTKLRALTHVRGPRAAVYACEAYLRKGLGQAGPRPRCFETAVPACYRALRVYTSLNPSPFQEVLSRRYRSPHGHPRVCWLGWMICIRGTSCPRQNDTWVVCMTWVLPAEQLSPIVNLHLND
eukprot:scaffold538_cov412-Prasinococcus_capsulatus_cf.AAC.9